MRGGDRVATTLSRSYRVLTICWAVLLAFGCQLSLWIFNGEQPDNYLVIEDLALTNMAVDNKAAGLNLSKQAMNVVPLEKDALTGPALSRRYGCVTKAVVDTIRGDVAVRVPLTPAPLGLDVRSPPKRCALSGARCPPNTVRTYRTPTGRPSGLHCGSGASQTEVSAF